MEKAKINCCADDGNTFIWPEYFFIAECIKSHIVIFSADVHLQCFHMVTLFLEEAFEAF